MTKRIFNAIIVKRYIITFDGVEYETYAKTGNITIYGNLEDGQDLIIDITYVGNGTLLESVFLSTLGPNDEYSITSILKDNMKEIEGKPSIPAKLDSKIKHFR